MELIRELNIINTANIAIKMITVIAKPAITNDFFTLNPKRVINNHNLSTVKFSRYKVIVKNRDFIIISIISKIISNVEIFTTTPLLYIGSSFVTIESDLNYKSR